ncbi:MAG: Hsp33 family molecular chaperone HslO [Lachnospiraceae bacterium]|nr:Hsp33 family molecular chaperone HslO [Lachnospiraceae bacterium]
MEDYIIRATAADNQIRAFAATTKNMVEKARACHNTSPVATAALGRLLTAGSMMGSMMKGDKDILTLMIRGQGAIGGITVTADSHGNVKGYVNEPMVLLPANEYGKLDVSGAIGPGTLTIIRDIGMKEPYQGQVQLISGEIAEDITYYYAVSEQTPSSVALGVLMNGNDAGEELVNTVRQAGGFIIQLMPDTSDSVIDALEKKLGEISSVTTMLNQGMSPEDILGEVLGEFGLNITERVATGFSCNCSRERVSKALISLGREELESIVNDGKPITLNCHFCNSDYEYSIDEIKEILAAKY